jgi:2-dehydro-3-deoxyphosphogluconate aldolase / (4S)-4-hydroxy-2-oxoglutarate aldolase
MTLTSPDIRTRLLSTGIIAILRRVPEKRLTDVVQAMIAGGIQAIEVTLDSPGALNAIATLRERHDDHILIGAGTVMTQAAFHEARHVGAQFYLSPHLDTSLVQEASRVDCIFMPGVFTASEVVQAERAGAGVLKLFPAGPLGTSYLRDLLGPFSGRAFFPSGGINGENAPHFIRAGAMGVGMGSALVPKDAIERGAWGEISKHVRQMLQGVQDAKRNQEPVVPHETIVST